MVNAAHDCAWVQADAADRDPARFWGYVVGALADVSPGLEAAAADRPSRRQAPMPARSWNGIANELTASAPVTLVIDDYHLIGNPKIDEALERLIELAPETFLLVLGTRIDPRLRLSRLRVRVTTRRDTGRHAAVRRRRSAPAARRRGTSPRTKQRALCDRTEGWAAGLVLAGLSLDRSDDHDAFRRGLPGRRPSRGRLPHRRVPRQVPPTATASAF